MTNYGYDFYFKVGDSALRLPITPGELKMTVGSNNKVINLINGGDINILKSPSLVEISFDARFPMRSAPYVNGGSVEFRFFHELFASLKEDKKPFRFIVARAIPTSTTLKTGVRKTTWDTNILVALEDYEIQESADEGDDVIISFKLKQYKEYGVKSVGKATPIRPTTDKVDPPKEYTTKEGDTTYLIARKQYGNGALHNVVYAENRDAIEASAKENGKISSSNGQYLTANTKLQLGGMRVGLAKTEGQEAGGVQFNSTRVTVNISTKISGGHDALTVFLYYTDPTGKQGVAGTYNEVGRNRKPIDVRVKKGSSLIIHCYVPVYLNDFNFHKRIACNFNGKKHAFTKKHGVHVAENKSVTRDMYYIHDQLYRFEFIAQGDHTTTNKIEIVPTVEHGGRSGSIPSNSGTGGNF